MPSKRSASRACGVIIASDKVSDLPLILTIITVLVLSTGLGGGGQCPKPSPGLVNEHWAEKQEYTEKQTWPYLRARVPTFVLTLNKIFLQDGIQGP
jgi:hypothetical protein